jgi:16S rRNA (guanine(966)-N(2))-methyltransferase RsmD
VRIIGGSRRGKVLPAFDKLNLRPTTDFAKESLFNILQHKTDLEDCYFLDLFAGTGSISYELMSRGAGGGILVDISNGSFRYRAKVLESLPWPSLKNRRADVFQFLRNCEETFDIIFADPPYDLSNLAEIPELIFQYELLKPGGLFILEHPESHTFGKAPHFLEHRKYGTVNFSFFQNTSP